MSSEYDQYLSSDELRQLTLRGSGFSQMQRLEELGINFELDPYGCPLVLYEDVKECSFKKVYQFGDAFSASLVLSQRPATITEAKNNRAIAISTK